MTNLFHSVKYVSSIRISFIYVLLILTSNIIMFHQWGLLWLDSKRISKHIPVTWNSICYVSWLSSTNDCTFLLLSDWYHSIYGWFQVNIGLQVWHDEEWYFVKYIYIYIHIFSVYNYLTFEDDILPDIQMIFYFCQVPRTAKLLRNSFLSVELHCYHPKWTFTDKIWLAYVRLNTKGTCESQHLSCPGSGHVLLSRNYGTRRVSIKT